jgi:hypothetical protein
MADLLAATVMPRHVDVPGAVSPPARM